MKLAFVVTALGITLSAATARAEGERPSRPMGEALPVWTGEIGYRASFVTDPGLNPFSPDDQLGQFSMGAERAVFARGRFAFATGLFWDVGGTSATARGDDASIIVHRFTLPLEARFGFAPWLYAFTRASAGAALVRAEVDDFTAPAHLIHSSWVPVLDLSAGGAYRIGNGGGEGKLGVWVIAEGGYGWAGRASLLLSPDLASDDPRRTGSVDLGTISLHGAFLRTGLALAF
jgi:hypothetical protein